MSTIHRPAPLNLWWYAAAALFAGAVLSLMILTLQSSGSGPTVSTDKTVTPVQTHHYSTHQNACFAGRPVSNIEFSGCVNRA
jgi:hypothetical protein